MSFKFNPFTGNFDIVGAGSSESFSYEELQLGQTVTIPLLQQMIVHGLFNVGEGFLDAQGVLVVIA